MSAITAPDLAKAIAGVVRAEFAKRRIPKKELAVVLERSLPTAYGRINGTLDWPAKDIERVADYLGMSRQRLFELAEDTTHLPHDEVERSLPVDPWAQPARTRERVA